MAYLTNQIGASYTFVSIRGAIFYKHDQIEVFQRPGVSGSGLRLLGQRGVPFTITTVKYHADFTAAKTAIANYAALIGLGSQALTRNSVSHGNFFVLEVDEVETIPVMNPAGNATSTDTVCQTAKWKLLAA